MRRSTGALVAAVVLGLGTVGCSGASDDAESAARTAGADAGPTTTVERPTTAACTQPGLPTTVAYAHVAGVDSNLLSLDVHPPRPSCDVPVVMWVHGGGYSIGDKSKQVDDKVRLFNAHGWIFVSVNYRLTVPGDPKSARYPDHYVDVAAAVAWVHAHIGEYGGDPAKIALLGHSAGADIVANVMTNPAYLAREGLGPGSVACMGPLDTEGFDKPEATRNEPTGESQQWEQSLGNDANYEFDTSATLLIKDGMRIPPTIGVVRGTPRRQKIERDFLARLSAAGVRTTTIDARSLTHQQVNTEIGAPDDTVMTGPLVEFLARCFAA